MGNRNYRKDGESHWLEQKILNTNKPLFEQ